jgi:hypothetical protein
MKNSNHDAVAPGFKIIELKVHSSKNIAYGFILCFCLLTYLVGLNVSAVENPELTTSLEAS